jgi:hypothetical protein
VFNRNNDAAMLAAVNAWRALNGLTSISPTFGTNDLKSLDIRASKSIRLNGSRRVELIAQVFTGPTLSSGDRCHDRGPESVYAALESGYDALHAASRHGPARASLREQS